MQIINSENVEKKGKILWHEESGLTLCVIFLGPAIFLLKEKTSN